VPGIYRPRHPERTVLYRVLFHHFDRFLAEYQSRFEREYGYFRPIIKEVVERCVTPSALRSGGAAGIFHKIPRIDDARLAEIFGREVLRLLVGKELLSPEWAERILSWPHTGFNVHSRVRAKTKPEAERAGKYMLRPILALERLTLLEPEGKVGYRWGRDGKRQETEVPDHRPPEAEVHCREAPAVASFDRGRPDGGRGERGIFHGWMIRRERESGVFRPAPTDVPCPDAGSSVHFREFRKN